MRLAGRDRRGAGCVAALVLLTAGLLAAQIGWLGSPELERLRRGAAELGAAWAAARHPDGFRPPRLALTLDDAARAKLADHIARAHAIGFIPHSDDDWMRGRLWLAGREFDARVRLKGDFLDHVRYGASLRVKLRGDARVLGLRTFNLQHPKTRRFLWEWAFMRHAAAEGLLVPRHEFVELVRDGGTPEPMLLIEHFSKELLERQARREGVILKFSEQDLYAAGIRKRELFGPDVNLLTGSGEAPLQVFGASRVAESPDLAYQRDRAFERFEEFRHGRRAAREVFDPERLGRWLAVSALWGAYHGFHWNNTRAYFDPARGRFEPVAYDGFAGPVSEEQYGEYLLHNADYAERHLFSDPLVSRAYARDLRRLTDPAALQKLLEDLVPLLQARVGFLSALPEFRDGVGRWTHFGWLFGNARALRERLDRPAEALAFWSPASAGGVLELSADSPLALVWETVELADGRVLRVPAEPRSLPFGLLPGRRHEVPVAARAYRFPPGLAPPRAVVVRVAGDPEAVPARIAVVSRRESAPAEPLGLTVSSGRLVRADPPPLPTLPDGFRVIERDGQHWVTARCART